MRSKTLLMAVAVFLTFTVAGLAQATFSASTTPQTGREGGGAERIGDVVLTVTAGAITAGSITYTFSTDLTVIDDTGDPAVDAPWISVTATDMALIADVEISGNVLTVSLVASGDPDDIGEEVRVSGGRVDLRGATPPVNVTLSAQGTAPNNSITAGQTVATVIAAITFPFEITDDDPDTVLATGGVADATKELTEGFTSAWTSLLQEDPTGMVAEITNGYQLRLRVTGVPEGAELTITTGGTVTGGVTLDPAAGTAVEGDGDDLEWIVEFGGPSPAIRETLEFTFDFDSADADIPLPAGDIRVFITSWPDPNSDIPFFVTDEIPADGNLLFTVSAAQTTLLAPLVQVVGAVDTGIAIDNTTGFGGIDGLTGAITFHFFPHDGSSFTYTTNGGSPGEGLNSSGEVEPGGSYIVLATELLDAAGFTGDTFRGHMFVVTDFTHAHGTFFNGDFATFFHSDTALVVGNEPDSRSVVTPESLGH